MFELVQLAGSRRTLRLYSPPVTPLAGAEWATKQRGAVRWLSGSNVASALLQGGEELPTEFRFRWRTADLSVGTMRAELVGQGPIRDADALVDLVRSIVRERSTVSIRWRHREVLAKLEEVRAEEQELGVYEPVRLRVQWLGPEALKTAPREKTINGPREALRNTIRAYHSALATARVPVTMARTAQTELEAALFTVNNALDEGARLVRTYASATGGGASDPALVGGVARSLRSFEDRARELSNLVGAASAGATAQTEGPAAIVEATHYRATVQRQSMRGEATAREQRAILDAMRSGEILGIVHAVEGLDLRFIALRWYGAADLWQELARYNGLKGSTLAAGDRVVIPRRKAV